MVELGGALVEFMVLTEVTSGKVPLPRQGVNLRESRACWPIDRCYDLMTFANIQACMKSVRCYRGGRKIDLIR